VTQNRADDSPGPSAFERLLYPILDDLHVRSPRRKLSDHLKRRGSPKEKNKKSPSK